MQKLKLHSISLDFEGYPTRKTLIYTLDPRVKIICTIFAIFAILLFTHWQTAMLVFASCTLLVLYFKAPAKVYFRRLLYPIYIIAFVSVIQPFTYGSTVIAQTPVFSLPIYLEGVGFGVLIFARCLAAVAVLNFLVLTTPLMMVLGSLEWFRVPSVLLDLALLTFRYIFVISEEASTIYKAQQARCGYSKTLSYFGRLRNYGVLFGMLFVRAYDRSVKVGNAMISRGYSGKTKLFTFLKNQHPQRISYAG